MPFTSLLLRIPRWDCFAPIIQPRIGSETFSLDKSPHSIQSLVHLAQVSAAAHGRIGLAAAPAAAGAGDVPSPLAGKVVSLDVAPGTAVKAGDQILTLEAMKMNTIIYAPASGTLTAFCVSAGDTVQEGQALAKIG